MRQNGEDALIWYRNCSNYILQITYTEDHFLEMSSIKTKQKNNNLNPNMIKLTGSCNYKLYKINVLESA